MRTLAAILGVLLHGAVALAGDRVETSDARRLEGRVLSIADGKLVLEADKQKQSLPVEEVMEVVFAEAADAMETAGQSLVATVPDDLLAVSDLAFDGTKLRLKGSLVGEAQLPVEAARRIYLPPSAQSPADVDRRYEEMKLPPTPGDRLLVARPDKGDLAVDGILEAIGPKTITFRWKDDSRQIGRDTVWLIRLASVAEKVPSRRGVVLGCDGSRISFTSLSLDARAVTFDTPAAGRHSVPRKGIAAIRFASERVTDLAELKPTAVKEYGYFETTFRHRVNRSVSGRPLRLGGRTYRTGLGLHSFCELTYGLDRQYKAFVATVGIDDAVRPNGDATVTFLGDGQPLADPLHVTGRTDPQPVRLKLEGVETFVIRVDFGRDDLGFSDHVDLAGARLLK